MMISPIMSVTCKGALPGTKGSVKAKFPSGTIMVRAMNSRLLEPYLVYKRREWCGKVRT